MARRKRWANTVTVHTSRELDDGTEVEIECECAVTPGEPEVRYQRNGDPGWPGCGPEVEVLSAVDDSGRDWTEEIDADRDWLSRVEEMAVESFGDEREAAKEEAADRAYDEMRERRAERD